MQRLAGRKESPRRQNIPKELDKAIRASAAFIAVLSRSYQNSNWCQKELASFLDEINKDDALETGGHGRLLKVIKFPWVDNAHEDFHRDYKDVSFFDRDKTGQENEFRRTSEAFRKAVDKLSFHIEKLFEAMLLGLERVFVAHAAADGSEERNSLIREIRAAGYALSPPPLGAIPIGLARERLRKYIRDATRASVHTLGVAFEPAVREQIDDALDERKMAIFYLTRGHEAASGKQKELIDEIRQNKWGLASGSYALLANRSRLEDLIKLLKPQPPAAAGTGNGAARVYVMCDPTSPEDADFGRELQGKIRDKLHFEVALPAADSPSRRAEHERLLGWCDGLLLYYPETPSNWYSRNLVDLRNAQNLPRERELRSKALLTAGSKVPDDVLVIQRREPILEQLEPFLAPLCAIAGGQGDAAHAGD